MGQYAWFLRSRLDCFLVGMLKALQFSAHDMGLFFGASSISISSIVSKGWLNSIMDSWVLVIFFECNDAIFGVNDPLGLPDDQFAVVGRLEFASVQLNCLMVVIRVFPFILCLLLLF